VVVEENYGSGGDKIHQAQTSRGTHKIKDNNLYS